jgi:hypothetical protein
MLWFDNATLRYLPKWAIDAATAAHFYEAVLATLAILVWHGYMVVFDPDVYPMDRAWITGRTSADRIRETSPAYYRLLVRIRERALRRLAAAPAAARPIVPPPPDKK